MRPLTNHHRSIIHPALLAARSTVDRLGLADHVYQAFRSQFDSAKRRQIAFQFAIEQWWHWWNAYDPEHGCVRWDRRGKGKNALVMARFGDVGPYSPENVYCATHSKNTTDCIGRDPARMAEQAREWHAHNVCHLKGKRGDRHPKAQAIITSAGRFGSGALAAEYFGISRAGAKYRADHGIDGWRWE